MSSLFKITTLCALSAALFTGCTSTSPSNELVRAVTVNAVTAEGIGQEIGTVLLSDSPAGLVIRTNLKQLPAGERGFHIHENGSCAPAMKDGKMGAALAAGSHYNPNQSPNHGTPVTGHLGDLPALKVNTDGTARVTLLAPRLKLADLQGRAIMVHAGGDNYSDNPLPLGGGGDRIACGVI
ncbi:superoxide dismutase [Cu-Zn] SodC [Acinetobacter pseudolwoffii]|uniref:superoxide dismutase [Cu-Zn] SodC n=1 Tax=Acinetobacter pseudolwoffii TaxID=2053287 RepID=UPI0021E44AC5|nr:superoxide dismutase [Cu-Zn] SodC [Acinetobacter pseudolwoffii]